MHNYTTQISAERAALKQK